MEYRLSEGGVSFKSSRQGCWNQTCKKILSFTERKLTISLEVAPPSLFVVSLKELQRTARLFKFC